MGNYTNYEWGQKMAFHSTPFKSVLDRVGKDLFSANGFETVKNEIGLTEIYNLMGTISKQWVIPVVYRDVVAEMGILQRVGMEYGTALQENYVNDIEGGNSPEVGAQTGDEIPFGDVALPTIEQFIQTVNNKDFFAQYTEDGRALKQAWISGADSNGLTELSGAMTAQVLRYKAKKEYAWVREAIDFILNNSDADKFPLKDTQKIELSAWTDSAPTDSQITELIGITKDVVNAMNDVVDVTTLNSAGVTGSMDASKLKLYMRKGYKKFIDKLLAYTYHDGKLDFPIAIHELPDFGGVIPTDANNSKLQAVYAPTAVNVNGKLIAKGGVIGYVDLKSGNNDVVVLNDGYAKKVGNAWKADIQIGADTTTVDLKQAVGSFDPNANVVAIIAEDGIIRELVEQELQVDTYKIYGTNLVQRKFYQNGNSIKVVCYKNFVAILAPSH